MLSDDEVFSLYQAEYFEKDYHCGTSEGSYTQEIAAMQEGFRPYIAKIKQFNSKGRYLEIGCAGGATLELARQEGFETVGVELSQDMAEWGRKNLHLDIRVGTLEQQHFPDNDFEVVYLGDVVEHLLHPKEVLGEIRRILKPNGVVAFAYPMELNHFTPRIRKLLKLQHQSVTKPYHLYYYTTKTLRTLLEQCGFEVTMEQESKLRRQRPILMNIMDSTNSIITKLTGAFGDRGFTIARVLKRN